MNELLVNKIAFSKTKLSSQISSVAKCTVGIENWRHLYVSRRIIINSTIDTKDPVDMIRIVPISSMLLVGYIALPVLCLFSEVIVSSMNIIYIYL